MNKKVLENWQKMAFYPNNPCFIVLYNVYQFSEDKILKQIQTVCNLSNINICNSNYRVGPDWISGNLPMGMVMMPFLRSLPLQDSNTRTNNIESHRKSFSMYDNKGINKIKTTITLCFILFNLFFLLLLSLAVY